MSNKKTCILRSPTYWKFASWKLSWSFKNFVSLQKEMNCIYCVVDLHAITTFQDPRNLKITFWRQQQVFWLQVLIQKKYNF